MDTWNAIRTERASLVDALAGLSDDAWQQPSLCVGWSVREVVAHLISTAQMTPPRFFGRMIASGFRFQAMTGANIRRVLDGRSDAELVTLYRSLVDARTAPPGPPSRGSARRSCTAKTSSVLSASTANTPPSTSRPSPTRTPQAICSSARRTGSPGYD